MTAAKKWGILATCPMLGYRPEWVHGSWFGQRTKRARFNTQTEAKRSARQAKGINPAFRYSVRELPR